MNRTTLPINEIIVENRQRIDLGDIDELAISIQRFGLIQPIVVNQDKRLIAGGRRYAAHIKLGLANIDVVYRETLSQDELHEMELEENVRRKEMTWQERVLNIKTIHDLKQKRAALEGSSWTQRATAEMLGIKGVSNVNYALRVAELIKAGDKEILSCENLSEAWRKIIKREEDSILAELASRTGQTSGARIGDFNSISPASALGAFGLPERVNLPLESKEPISDSSAKDAALEQYKKNPLNKLEDFDSYYSSLLSLRSKKEQHRNTIHLSKMLYCCDSIELMNHPDCKERFDAIITDIPYGIDMDMLNQGNDGHAFQDIETVLEEHTVEGNVELFKRFFPAAFHCLKNNTYLITFCDQMQWQLMYDLATQAGFKVQRWPITWVKTSSCMNQCANTNFTKTIEIAIVCRKGTATLTRANIPTHILAGHDDMKDTLGHPFTKPFLLWSHLIDAVTLEGQHILEPFVGRGSGLISLLRKKRHVTACEINVEHFNALVENTKQYFLNQNPNIQFA